MKDLIIVGAGGAGRETAWIVEQINEEKETYNLLGFVDDNEELWNKKINGYDVLGGIDYLLSIKNYTTIVIAIANYEIKKKIVEKLKNKNLKYENIIHPKVKFNNIIKLGEGIIIYEGVIISPNVELGSHVIISPKCGIGHDSIIGDYVSLLWNVNISGNDVIEEGVIFGSGSTIIQGKTIGKGTFIGAGAVVIDNIEKNKVVVGVPAKAIKNKG